MKVSVLIVEDVEEMRLLLREVVSGAEGLVVSGSAANGFEARSELLRRRPDVVLLDEILPGESSLDLLKDFVAEGVRVILITSTDYSGLKMPPLPPGAVGRLSKPSWESLETDSRKIAAAILTGVAKRRA